MRSNSVKINNSLTDEDAIVELKHTDNANSNIPSLTIKDNSMLEIHNE